MMLPAASHYELGVSQESQQLAASVEQFRNHASETISYGWRTDLAYQLKKIQSSRSSRDWDGHDAVPITRQTMLAAIAFLRSLPDYIEIPEIIPEPTGDLGFQWEKGSDIIFVVAISSESIGFAKLTGSGKSHGEVKFSNDIPVNIKNTLLDYFLI